MADIGDIYERDLDGAKPVIFKPYYDLCPNDCGGKYFDEVEYKPHCPTCDKILDDLLLSDLKHYCSYCGTKIWKHYKYPHLIMSDDEE